MRVVNILSKSAALLLFFVDHGSRYDSNLINSPDVSLVS